MMKYNYAKKLIKLINIVFLVVLSIIFLTLSFRTFIFSPQAFINLYKNYGNIITVILPIVFLFQFISKIIEYNLIDKSRFIFRQIIITLVILSLSVFLIVFINIFKITTYNDLLLSFSIPVSLICISGILTFVNVIKLFYIDPSLLFTITAIGLIVVSTILLHLPISSATGEPIPLIDALFVVTSAASCTGLSTISIGNELSLIGQIILMLTIELGGLLIILISTVGILLGFVSGDAIVRLKMAASSFEMRDVVETQKLIAKFLAITFLSQIIVGVIIYPYFLEMEKDSSKAVFYSIFHVISALNNAGFSQYDDSLIRFNNSPIFLMAIAYLILLGDTSIITITEIFSYINTKIKNLINRILGRKEAEVFYFSLFSKIIMISHLTLIILGTFSLFVFEGDHFLKQVKYPLVSAIFNSISFRTAGFAVFDFTQAKDFTYLFFSILMFIGGGSISMAGGIKMNTVALFLVSLIAFLKSYPSLYLFRKEIDFQSLIRATAVFIGGVLLVTTMVFILYEIVREERISKIIFEVCSAFGTVGMSSGLTSKNLPSSAKLVLIFTMFFGKIGLITMLSIFVRRGVRYIGTFKKESIIVG